MDSKEPELIDYSEGDFDVISLSDDYFVCVGYSSSTTSKIDYCYHVVNREYGVIEAESQNLPQAIIHLTHLQGCLDKIMEEGETPPEVILASITNIDGTKHLDE